MTIPEPLGPGTHNDEPELLTWWAYRYYNAAEGRLQDQSPVAYAKIGYDLQEPTTEC